MLSSINVFGVYVAPISFWIVVAWAITRIFQSVAGRLGLLRYVWHPALFELAIYIIVLSSSILFVARMSSL